jgi:long-chain acyl-CoA synthetase
VVLLDDAPRSARVVTADRTQDVDLGSHHGLSIEGERDVRGSDEEAVIVYTSAMQGRPLGAIVTHANILANARSGIEAMGCTADDVTLAFLPYSHLFGFTITAGTALLAGGQVRTMPRFHPGRVMKQFEDGVTVFVGVPSVFRAMLGEIVERGLRLRDTAVRLTLCGGAPLSLELQERWFDATGIELRQGYGLTEAGPVCLFNRVDRPNVPGTLGHPFPNVDVAIMPPADYSRDAEREQPEAQALPVGVTGEICVRGENVSPGYIGGGRGGLPRRGQWLCTGDEGVLNADGTVTFLGLVKPMFTRNAFNIYPREIERAVCELAGVRSAEVTPIPQRDRKGNATVSNEYDIRLRVAGDVTREQVAAWCESRLSAYKQPTEIEMVPSSEGESRF